MQEAKRKVFYEEVIMNKNLYTRVLPPETVQKAELVILNTIGCEINVHSMFGKFDIHALSYKWAKPKSEASNSILVVYMDVCGSSASILFHCLLFRTALTGSWMRNRTVQTSITTPYGMSSLQLVAA